MNVLFVFDIDNIDYFVMDIFVCFYNIDYFVIDILIF